MRQSKGQEHITVIYNNIVVIVRPNVKLMNGMVGINPHTSSRPLNTDRDGMDDDAQRNQNAHISKAVI